MGIGVCIGGAISSKPGLETLELASAGKGVVWGCDARVYED
jgi:hypothetical protein